MTSFIKEIFNINSSEQFNEVCLKVFNYQYKENKIYKKYVDELKVKINNIENCDQIPFLPVEFFKTHKIITGTGVVQKIFKSSGTTGFVASSHYITDLNIYEKSFVKTFNLFYGKPEKYTFLALLPSYSERNDSSLIYMVQKLMNISNKKDNRFYLYDHQELFEKITDLEKQNKKTILFGVSFALIDFFEKYNIELKHTTIIETGGMKGRKKEIVREELHSVIKSATGLSGIHSEYGMTELLSQAYSKSNNLYKTPPWMKILIRDTNDPFDYIETGKSGGINIIDLANIYSCSFIETKDLGKKLSDGSFEVLGRFDDSDIRGCNLMVL
ncbi:MAG: acyltransferase [Bacteroidales bacterium]|nr:acyltransferase [Bacteroidales bacterium]